MARKQPKRGESRTNDPVSSFFVAEFTVRSVRTTRAFSGNCNPREVAAHPWHQASWMPATP
eukprot:5403296-Amphidinium_carterae.1